MRRHERHARRQMRLHLRDHRGFHRAHIGHDGSPASRPGAMAARRSPHAPTGTHRITRSAPRTPAASIASSTSSAMPSSRTRASVASSAVDGDDRSRGLAVSDGAGDRRTDQPEADQRDALEERLLRAAGPDAQASGPPSGSRARPPTTTPFASSLPTVRRSASDNP